MVYQKLVSGLVLQEISIIIMDLHKFLFHRSCFQSLQIIFMKVVTGTSTFILNPTSLHFFYKVVHLLSFMF